MEPLLIELIVLGVLGVLWFLRVSGERTVEVPARLLQGATSLLGDDADKAGQQLAEPMAEAGGRIDSLRALWLGLSHSRLGRPDDALVAFRASGLACPEQVMLELERSEPGTRAADRVVELAASLQVGSVRVVEARLRTFEREDRNELIWATVRDSEIDVPRGLAARAASRALIAGLKVSSRSLGRFGIDPVVVERARLVRDFERQKEDRQPLQDVCRLLAAARRAGCADLPVVEDRGLPSLFRDLVGLSPSASPGAEAPSTEWPEDRPALAIEALADSSIEQFASALQDWARGPLRGPLARNLSRAARQRGPGLLRELERLPSSRLGLDRVRLCTIHSAVRPPHAGREPVPPGFSVLEFVEALFALPTEFALAIVLEHDDRLWVSLRDHPRPEASLLFGCLDEPQLGGRCLDWLRQRPELVAEYVCEGLRDPERRDLVRRHLLRVPEVSARALFRALSSESEPVAEWVDGLSALGPATLPALADCAGSPPLERLALWVARRLPLQTKEQIGVITAERKARHDELGAEFLSRLRHEIGSEHRESRR